MTWTPTIFSAATFGAVSGNQVIYTVPAGTVAIVTHWQVTPTNQPAANMDMYLCANNFTYGGMLAHSRAYQSNTTGEFKGFWPIMATDQMSVYLNDSTSGPNLWQNVHGLVAPVGEKILGGDPWRLSYFATATADTVAYTVPTGRTLILKNYVVTSMTTSSNSIGVRGHQGAPIGGWYTLLNPAQTVQYDGPWVLPAGASIVLNLGTGTTSPAGVACYFGGVLL